MATTIFNQASTDYQLAGSSEQLNVTSNVNEITLQDSQGLSLTKTSSSNSFAIGEILTYTVTITNNSGQYLNGVRIIDNLGGANLAYVLGSGRLTIGSLTYPVNPIATNPLTFTLQQLGIGQTMTLTYNAQVIFNLPSSVQTITNTVQGIGYTATGTINGFASTSIQKKTNGDLALNKTASQTMVFPNQIFSYFLTHTNSSNSIIDVNSITDQLPSNFVLNQVYIKVGTGANTELVATDYSLTGTNFLTISTVLGNSISIPANSSAVVTLVGYLS